MDIIDSIYEASMAAERWPLVFEEIAQAVGCDKAGMYALSFLQREVIAWAGNERGHDAMHAFLAGGWASRSSQAARMFALSEPRFVSDLDVFTREELETDPYYQGFLKPVGAFWGAGTFVDGPTDNKIVVTIHRPYEMGPLKPESVAFLTGLRPHIARSTFLASQFRLERLRSAVEAMGLVGLPAAALAASGRLLLANAQFEADMPAIFADRRDRLHMSERNADRLLGETIREGHPTRGASFALKTIDGNARNIIHLLPMRGAARDLFTGTEWLLIAPPVGQIAANEPAPGVLEALFDLTPAEARLARRIQGGSTLAEIAADTALSVETLRTQLKGIFRKTGVAKQIELVRLLMAVNLGAERGYRR